MLTEKKFRFPFILITTVFFGWEIPQKLKPVLVSYFKQTCQFTGLRSAFIAPAFFISTSVINTAMAFGGLFLVLVGGLSGKSTIQTAYLMPLLCFFVIPFFALSTTVKQIFTPSIAHP